MSTEAQGVTVARLESGSLGFQLVLPDAETDYIQSKLARGEVYEQELLEDITKRVSLGSLVLDVGANIGGHSCYLAAAGLSVVAFEPDPHLVAALRQSVALNGFLDRVDVRGYAIGKASGRGELVTPDPTNLGTQQVRTPDPASPHPGSVQETLILTLDQQTYPARVSAIKIDVEGMELDVLAGAAALLEQDRPCVYVEALSSEQFRSTYKLLGRLGYRYHATFNFSPTHLFVPGYEPLASESLDSIATLANRMYSSELALQATHAHLRNANTKYRSATALVTSLRAQLNSSSPSAESKSSPELADQMDDMLRLLEAGHVREVEHANRAVSLQSGIEARDNELRRLTETLVSARASSTEADELRVAKRQIEFERDALAKRLDHARAQNVRRRQRSVLLRHQLEQATGKLIDALAHLDDACTALEEHRQTNDILNARSAVERDVAAEQLGRIAVLEYEIRRSRARAATSREDQTVLRNWIRAAQERELASDAEIALLQADKAAAARLTELEPEVEALREAITAGGKAREILVARQQKRERELQAMISLLETDRGAAEQLRTLEPQVASLRRDVAASATHLKQLKALRRSKTYRTGMAVREGFTTFRGFFRLPFKLIAIAREKSPDTTRYSQQHENEQGATR